MDDVNTLRMEKKNCRICNSVVHVTGTSFLKYFSNKKMFNFKKQGMCLKKKTKPNGTGSSIRIYSSQ